MQSPTSTTQNQPSTTEGQFKEIANNIFDQVTKEPDTDGTQGKQINKLGSKEHHDDDLVEHLSQKHGSQAASVKGSRTHLEEPTPSVNPEEIGKSLRELHSKIDEVFRKNPNLRNQMYNSIAASTISDRDRRGYTSGTYHQETGGNRPYHNPFGGITETRAYDPILNTPLRDARVNATDINYLRYSQSIARNERPQELPREPLKYDKDKLDSIINNIVNRTGQGVSYRPSADSRAANEMTQSKYSNYYQEETRSQAGRRQGDQSLHQSRIEPPKHYYCGELENDEDSIILGYAKKVEEDRKKKYNYHCGDLEDDDN